MPNHNPQAIAAVNQRLRVWADFAARLRNRTRLSLDKIQADGIDSLFSGDDKDTIEDGSAEDGRSRLTNEDIKRLLDAMQRVDQFFADNPELTQIVLRVSVNPEQL